jgi:tRNA (guanine6-N2)-methyltransferase
MRLFTESRGGVLLIEYGRKSKGYSSAGSPGHEYELEVIPGLEEFAEREVRERHGASIKVPTRRYRGRVPIVYHGNPVSLNRLRSVVATHIVVTFHVSRPSAFLGHEYFGRLLRLFESVIALHPDETFRSFRVSAAGSNSPVFRRLRGGISKATRLYDTEEPAHLQVSFRRPPGGNPGWQVLVRLSPKSISARPWRTCDFAGALNASVASIMVGLTKPTPGDTYLNLACGSATLMVERFELESRVNVIGVDLSGTALECARANLHASGHARKAYLIRADVKRVPLAPSTADVIVADLPYGMLAGGDSDIPNLYSAVVQESTRLAACYSQLVVITARNKAFRKALSGFEDRWDMEAVYPIKIPFRSGYIQPRIYSL